MADDVVRDLLLRSGISFVGTVQQLGAATMADLPVDDHTAVVVVDQVLQAPPAFAGLAGSHVTVQLAAGDLPDVGNQYAFFANALAFGDSLAVTEVGRVSESGIAPHLAVSNAPDGEQPIASLQAGIDADRLSAHADAAAAVVVAGVTKLEKVGPSIRSEHDPDWWVATLQVHHIERGTVPDVLTVAYANSLDVRWRRSPKPRAGQSGLWLLHNSIEPVSQYAPYYLPDPEDYQPVQSLDAMRAAGGAS